MSPPRGNVPGVPATHSVTNQVPPLTGTDVTTSAALLEGLHREGAGWAEAEVRQLGRLANGDQAQQWARLADEHPPVLHTHDRYGHRVDEVEYQPAYHELLAVAVAHGLHAMPWHDPRPGAHVARAAGVFAWGASDAGHLCPISMTYSVVPALRAEPALAADYEPLLTTGEYDPGLRPPLSKRGLLAGMSMTEKQGGSDVRANTTRAVPTADGSYRLTGHKWFTSAPMSDLFLTLAQAPGGLTCFLVPRVLPDGARNPFALQRLKDKLGNRSNASAEVEYDATLAWRVGDEGRGVRTIIEMVTLTRLDCALTAATGMRVGLAHALHHAEHRRAFGARLVEQPAMTNVLADLAIESEAATTLVLRLAGAVDRGVRGDRQEAAFRRLALAVAKYWLCKRWSGHTAEALECLGGNGYVRSPACRGCTGRRHWCPSGRARATSRHSTRCVPWPVNRRRRRRCWPNSTRRPARTGGWTTRSPGCAKSSPTAVTWNTAPGGSSSCWRSPCRARCWSGTPRRPSPTPSAAPGWAGTGAPPTAPCRPGWTPREYSPASVC